MPILVRPVREQLEHDRIIRLLQARYQKKHDPVINIGHEPPTSIVIGTAEFVPDLILVANDKARKIEGVVEVETGESVNSLEALAQWSPFSRLRVPFHLYVPPNSLDTVRRLCRDHNVTVAELWTYHTNLDQVRFTMVQKAPDAALNAARKAGLSGTPKLKVAPPPPPPPPPLPPPPPVSVRGNQDTKAPTRTAAQKASFGKFVAAAKASAAKHAGAPAMPPPPPAVKTKPAAQSQPANAGQAAAVSTGKTSSPAPTSKTPAEATPATAAPPARTSAKAKPASPAPAAKTSAKAPAKHAVKAAAKGKAKPAKAAGKPAAKAGSPGKSAAAARHKSAAKPAARKASTGKAAARGPAGKRR